MRFIRYQLEHTAPSYGWVYENKIGPIEGDPFGEYRRLEAEIPLEAVRLLPPVVPSKIICLGRNYEEHAREQNADVPQVPLIFMKPPSALIGIGEKIVLPPQSRLIEHEAELAVVVGKRGRWIGAEEAGAHIFGYTIANDVTARDLQRSDNQWTRGKGFDTFCPLGPWIETEMDPYDILITCRVNENIRQMASTRDMIFSIQQIIAFVSSVMTIEPGDLILTGTPAGVGPLEPGDRVNISIENIGELENGVVNDPRRV
jgi:2-keto-4-pentenoate hydratase/2-oxohepta-3-ene-1,7-dioic acid hydratase in catechol pathway